MPVRKCLNFPVCSVDQLATLMIPKSDGGLLDHVGQVEVISSQKRDGSDLENNLRWGVYVTFEAPSDYVKNCFLDYGLITDSKGIYTAIWRPYHLIGLELGISIANIALLGQATGTAHEFKADVVAVAKRNINSGEILDGEGGFTVWGRVIPAAESTNMSALPIGLAQGIQVKRKVSEGEVLTWSDVSPSEKHSSSLAYKLRHEMLGNFHLSHKK